MTWVHVKAEQNLTNESGPSPNPQEETAVIYFADFFNLQFVHEGFDFGVVN